MRFMARPASMRTSWGAKARPNIGSSPRQPRAQLPTRRVDDRQPSGDHGLSSKQYGLFTILDRLAEEDGDFDRRIALLTKDLSAAAAYDKLVELCLAHGRREAALKWAEEGLWLFQDISAERLSRKTASLYHESGRTADAEALLWRCFDRRPSVHLHR